MLSVLLCNKYPYRWNLQSHTIRHVGDLKSKLRILRQKQALLYITNTSDKKLDIKSYIVFTKIYENEATST